ncbi:MAG: hypothetical protein ACOY32_00515 [Thermodesulfobacteriota bacterium]
MKRFLSHFEEMPVANLADATVARRMAGEVALAMGLSSQRAAEAVLVASELAHNHVMHATSNGSLRISGFHLAESPCLAVVSLDQGPGLNAPFLQLVRAGRHGEGLGAGLKTVVRLSDRVDCFSRRETDIDSDYETVIVALLGDESLPPEVTCRAAGGLAVISRARVGSHLYGDGVKMQQDERFLRLTLVDSPGLGGKAAETTAAVFAALDSYPLLWPPGHVLEELEFVLAGTNGAAVASLLLNRVTGRLQSAAVGHGGALLYVDGRKVEDGRISGIVGQSRWRRIVGRDYAGGTSITACLHSDGHRPFSSLPSLTLPPLLLAHLLFAPQKPLRDDATLLVLQWPEKVTTPCTS